MVELTQSVASLKGVGEKTAKTLEAAGIKTLLDLILYFPRDYERIEALSLRSEQGEEKAKVAARFQSAARPVRTRTGKTLTTLRFDSLRGPIRAAYFNMPYAAKQFTPGQQVLLYGRFKREGKALSVVNPQVLRDMEDERHTPRTLIARYPLKEHLTEHLLRKLVQQVLSGVRIRENLPQDLLESTGYPSLDEALRAIHQPDSPYFERALERLKFQELFAYSMKIQAAKAERREDHTGIVFAMSPRLRAFRDALPYELTLAQRRSIREILTDQKKDRPMNRLLQGDVGSGKTVVALTALFNVVENGRQGLLMAPTEILVQQHAKEARELLTPFDIQVEVLTGSTSAAERRRILTSLKDKAPMVLVGTHALLEGDVEVPALGLVVTDEQHRFGVNQRLLLREKHEGTDVLVMSATPIPRTLALHLYSDLDLSVLDELPPGRQKTRTKVYGPGERQRAYLKVQEEIQKGHQAYVVCPLIEAKEESKLLSVEALTANLQEGPLQKARIASIHGRMKSAQKNELMDAFAQGAYDVLVSTTVIEVGVNVPNATVMVVENAERFGLSSLHQLRGRVGRGAEAAYCLLIFAGASEATKERLDVMAQTTDGFRIAQKDLEMRGSGALFGTNQSGESGLILADFIQDYPLFIEASRWAEIVFSAQNKEHRDIRDEFLATLDDGFHLVCVT
ncbi:ATP-dependent DNA helicase RecG [Clostridiaceae bacterium JG1575]|nr:ATP-dependent DNA helicase RecG [Clostridiaceae bacterium JG1575]